MTVSPGTPRRERLRFHAHFIAYHLICQKGIVLPSMCIALPFRHERDQRLRIKVLGVTFILQNALMHAPVGAVVTPTCGYAWCCNPEHLAMHRRSVTANVRRSEQSPPAGAPLRTNADRNPGAAAPRGSVPMTCPGAVTTHEGRRP